MLKNFPVALERQSSAENSALRQAAHSLTTQPLRIAQLATLYERVPPNFYGGAERGISYLTEELVRRGHDVTLFASADSVTSAKLVPGFPRSLRLAGLSVPAVGPGLHLPMLAEAYGNARSFDVIHSHLDFWCFPFARLSSTPTVVTMHGRLDVEESKLVYERFPDIPLVSLSQTQRAQLPTMNWLGSVYQGLPRDLLKFNPHPGSYLAFLGRISPEKRVDIAIEVALRVGIPLKIAAKVDAVDREYFDTLIKPKLCSPSVEYIGEIAEHEKNEFLGNAIALLFTIGWPEPFGLAMIEALACGVPVVACPYGSVLEVVRDGETGFIGSTVEELVAGVTRIDGLSRATCRAEFDGRFTSTHMALRYEQIYLNLMHAREQKLRLGAAHTNGVAQKNPAP
jgi:glycosyltransferase involved in cell wall biosynthesis